MTMPISAPSDVRQFSTSGRGAMIRSHTRLETRNHARMLLVLLAVAAIAAGLAACSSFGQSSTGTSSSAAVAAGSLKTASIGGVTVLTSARGFTLYSFAPGTPATSNCNGTCAQNWPLVPAPGTSGCPSESFAGSHCRAPTARVSRAPPLASWSLRSMLIEGSSVRRRGT